VIIDTPLEEESGDSLDRGPFASLVAKALLAENKQRATVVGLVGGWGTGKSTVANFTLAKIKEADKDIEIIRFEPWMVTTTEALAREFFKELGKAVLPKDDSKDAREKRARFYKYTALTLDALALTTDAGGTLGVPFTGLASKAFKGSRKAIDLAAKGLEAQAHQPTLREARESLSKALIGLKRPVVVVIDDIDRLNADEMRTVFQIIKACADFPNVRYLLLFDRKQVVHALGESVSDPNAFLEKIVGQSFDLPAATRAQRISVLDEAVTALGLHEGLPKEDFERLSSVFDRILLPGLNTLRHVKRFVNTVRTLIPGVIVDGFRNIDPADFLALEFIRQYAPDYYAVIRDEHAPLPGGKFVELVNPKETEKERAEKKAAVLSSIQEPYKKLVEEAVKSFDSRSMSPERSRRFNTEYWRPVYLGFHEGRARVPEARWKAFVEALATPDQEQTWLKEWSDREKRDEWVAAITTRVLDIPWPESLNLLRILFDWGEVQRQETSKFMGQYHSWEFCVRFCVDAIMSVTPDDLNPVEELLKVMKDSTSIVASGYSVGTEAERNRKNDYDRWAREYDLSPLIEALQPRLTAMITDESIWECSDVSTAMAAAHYLVEKNLYDEWWESIPKNEYRLVNYLDKDLGEVETFNYGFEESPLVEAIRNIDPEKLTEKGKEARMNVLRSIRNGPRVDPFRRRPVAD